MTTVYTKLDVKSSVIPVTLAHYAKSDSCYVYLALIMKQNIRVVFTKYTNLFCITDFGSLKTEWNWEEKNIFSKMYPFKKCLKVFYEYQYKHFTKHKKDKISNINTSYNRVIKQLIPLECIIAT